MFFKVRQKSHKKMETPIVDLAGLKVKKVVAVSQTLSSLYFERLTQLLIEDPYICQVQIRFCTVHEPDVIKFVSRLPEYSLKVLQIDGSGLTAQTAKAIATAVQASSLETLHLSSNQIKTDGAIALAFALKDSGLDSLNLAGNGISNEAAIVFGDILKEHSTNLKELDLSVNPIECLGAIAIASALPKSRLETLHLNGCRIRDQGIMKLCRAVQSSPRLTQLGLSGNRLSEQYPDRGERLSNMIRVSNLETIRLCGMLLSDSDVQVIADGIKGSNTLRTLLLTNNHGIHNIDPILVAAKTHRTLRCVGLDGTGVPVVKQHEMMCLTARLFCERSQKMTILCSVYTRVGIHSTFHAFPKDLLRRLALFL